MPRTPEEEEAYNASLVEAQRLMAIATIWADETLLFPLYVIGTKLCTSRTDFQYHFVYDTALKVKLKGLLDCGFLTEEDGRFTLTPLGEETIAPLLPGGEQ